MENRKTIFALAAFMAFAATGSHAACYADYKAKKDNPLKLHYGVLKIKDGNGCPSAADIGGPVAERLRTEGWQLLNVLSTFDDSGLESRRTNAGQYFLRF